MHSASHEAWITTLLARAAELRAAGILSIAADGFAATFAPQDTPTAGDIEAPDVAPEHADPLHDPASYPGGIVPGFSITRIEVE